MSEYQSKTIKNSANGKEEVAEKKVEKVVNGVVKTRTNEGRKLISMFVSDDVDNVKSYLFRDILVPAAKKLISDIVTDGISMILYGSTGGTQKRSTSNVSYRSYYDSRRDDPRDRGGSRYQPLDRFNQDDLVFETRREAECVREQLYDILHKYRVATVADLYDLAGLNPPYTSVRYGWINIDSAEVRRVSDGYILKLPKATPID